MKRASFLVLSLFLISLSVTASAETETETKPYGKCELLLMRTTDKLRRTIKGAVNTLDRRITPVAPWDISAEEEAEITKIFSDESLLIEKRFEKAYHFLIAAHTKKLNPISKFFVKNAVEDSLKQNSIYAKTIGALALKYFGPHYNPLFNRTKTYVRPGEGTTPLDTIVAVHETEHLLHRNTNPLFWMLAIKIGTIETFSIFARTPLLVPIRRRQEVRALGAQWELARLIPLEIRAQLLREWRFEKSYITQSQQLWLRALIKSGALTRAVNIMEQGLALESTGLGDGLSRSALEETIVARLLGGVTDTKWYSAFLKRAKDRVDPDEIDFIRGMAHSGLDHPPLRSMLNEYLASHSESEVLGDQGLDLQQLKFLQGVISQLRYGDRFADALDEVYGATLEYAGLPKDEFIERLSQVQGYTLENIYHHHYTTSSRLYLLLTSYGAALGTMVEFLPPGYIISPDIHAFYNLVAYLFGY